MELCKSQLLGKLPGSEGDHSQTSELRQAVLSWLAAVWKAQMRCDIWQTEPKPTRAGQGDEQMLAVKYRCQGLLSKLST